MPTNLPIDPFRNPPALCRRPKRSAGFLVLLVFCLTLAFGGPTLAQGEPAAGSLTPRVDGRMDARIERGIVERLAQLEGTDGVEVRVEAGVVTLSGSVMHSETQERVRRLASRIDGVAEVVDEISLVTDPTARLGPAMDNAIERLQLLASYLPLLVVSLVVVFLFWMLARLVGRFDRLFDRIKINRFGRDLLKQAVQVAVLLTGILIALEIMDATALVGAVLGAAGIAGLAIGFAFKDLVENYISSILLSIRQPFNPDDHVVIDDQEGKVVRLTSRATILMTLDGNHLRIPNSQVFKATILNYSRNPLRRFSFGIGLGVNEDMKGAQALGLEALTATPGVVDEPGSLSLIEELGDSNVLLRFYGWVDQRSASFGKVRGNAIRRVKTALENAGMDLPEPIYRVHLLQPAELAPPLADEATHRPKDPESVSLAEEIDDVKPDRHLEDQMAQERSEHPDDTLLAESGKLE